MLCNQITYIDARGCVCVLLASIDINHATFAGDTVVARKSEQ